MNWLVINHVKMQKDIPKHGLFVFWTVNHQNKQFKDVTTDIFH